MEKAGFNIAERMRKLFGEFGKWGRGSSEAASKRRAWRQRAVTHSAQHPGQVIKMSRNRVYVVQKNGSFRRVKESHVQEAA